MKLLTDEQTIDDLCIFSKRDTAGIYDIYNQSHTRGGERILQEMFRNPLSEKEAINRRSNIIEHFARLNLAFPFDPSLFDMAEKYLATGNKQTNNQQSLLGEKEILNGVTAVIELIQITRDFIAKQEMLSIAAYAQHRNVIMSLLSHPAIEPILKEKTKGKLSYSAIAAYDQLLRVRELHKIEKLLEQLYYLDVYLSVAKVAISRKFIFPIALDKGECRLKLEGVYHPELKDPVANDVTMDAGGNVIFLTGANMAGKSTFLRAVSTAVYIAHMGFPVAARTMEFSVMDGMYTTINLPDNLGIGASHFYAEVLRLKKVATELGQGRSLFIIFDELFRGTNVKDAHDATVAATQAFSKKETSMFIISSHIVEAGEELQPFRNIGFLFLPTRMEGHIPAYTYKLEKGITGDRHGMIIIRNEGILDILEKGRSRASQLKVS